MTEWRAARRRNANLRLTAAAYAGFRDLRNKSKEIP
jgi:hypothetical protein